MTDFCPGTICTTCEQPYGIINGDAYGCEEHAEARIELGIDAEDGNIEIVSFGYGHGAPPEAHLTLDLREHFRDPHVNPALRHLTAADKSVTAAVLATPGIPELITAAALAADAFLCGPTSAPLTIAVGCVGGRHRSAAVAEAIGRELVALGVPVAVTHRDIQRPVIKR